MFDRELARRASAEAVGTALLTAAVVGSGIAAQRSSPSDAGLQLLENAVATGAVLVALILALGAISGAHLNPIVTLADRVLGGVSSRDAAFYVGAQTLGACVGAVVANLMFDLPAVTWSTHERSGSGQWLGEVVAAFGLLLVILGATRVKNGQTVAFAVGAYITGAYWFTSSTSFANPAVTVGRTLTDTFAGIDPADVPVFVVMQVIGAMAAVALMHLWRPGLDAHGVVVPHESAESA